MKFFAYGFKTKFGIYLLCLSSLMACGTEASDITEPELEIPDNTGIENEGSNPVPNAQADLNCA